MRPVNKQSPYVGRVYKRPDTYLYPSRDPHYVNYFIITHVERPGRHYRGGDAHCRLLYFNGIRYIDTDECVDALEIVRKFKPLL